MGLEDRDWYREKPSDSWKERWGGGSGGWRRGPTEPVQESWQPLPARASSGGVTLRAGVWSAVAVSALATAALWRFDILRVDVPAVAPPTVVQPVPVVPAAPPVAPTPSNVVRLTPKPGLDTPVTSVVSWSVTGPRFGTVSVLVPIGKTPREALTVGFAERGFQLVG